jgi:Tol biopolymer transport system component
MSVTVLAGADQPPPSEDLRSELKTYPHKVVFETNRDGNWELYLVNADGSSPVNLTQMLAIDELYPKPSPDGTKIAYVADQGEGEHRVRDVYVTRCGSSSAL